MGVLGLVGTVFDSFSFLVPAFGFLDARHAPPHRLRIRLWLLFVEDSTISVFFSRCFLVFLTFVRLVILVAIFVDN